MEKRINYGISISRILFSFFIICFHFHRNWSSYPVVYIFLRELAVPVFLIIAFFLGSKVVFSDNITVLVRRIKRLLLPYLFWGIFSWIICILADRILKGDSSISIRDLIWQVCTGSVEAINPVCWYLWDLMFLTICIWLLHRFFGKNVTQLLLVVISVCCLILQYDGCICRYCGELCYELRFITGRLFEIFPFATMGLLFSENKLVAKMEGKRNVWIIVLGLALAIMLPLKDILFVKPQYTMAYAGLANVIVAPILFLFMYLFPFAKIGDKLKKIIGGIAKYTMGVFLSHWIVGNIFNDVLSKMNRTQYTFTGCIIIFILSWGISFMIAKIPLKHSEQFVS